MNKILIDNATITSVLRALGKIPLNESALLDIEQVSLARFCHAVLLSERIILPQKADKRETAAEKSLLSHDIFSYEPLHEHEAEELKDIASSLLGLWSVAFQANENPSLFSEYFSQINAFSNFIWEHSRSEFFLVFRAHGISKESPLIEAILASPTNEEQGKRLRIYAGNGQSVQWERLSRHVQRMLAVMGRLGTEYIWHQIFAANHRATYISHPLKDFFSYDFLNRMNQGAQAPEEFERAFRHGSGKFSGRLKDSLKTLTDIPAGATFELPDFLPILVQKSSSRKDFLHVLYQFRKEEKVLQLREMLSSIEKSISSENSVALARLTRDIEKIGNTLVRENGLKEKFMHHSPPSTILSIKISGEETSMELPITAPLYKRYFLGKRYQAWVGRAMDELGIPATYGELKDKLDRFAWIKEEKFPKFYLKEDRFPSKYHKEFISSTPPISS